MIIIIKVVLFFLCISEIKSQISYDIIDYKTFPNEFKILDITPNRIEWGIAGGFILLDNMNQQIAGIDAMNEFQLIGGVGGSAIHLSEPIWAGVLPDGVAAVDRLDNKIIYFDYRLNYINNVSIEPRIYPELVTVDNWGNIYMYSSQFNSIFIFKKKILEKTPFINLNYHQNIDACIKEIITNDDGDLCILSCNNSAHIFSRNGVYKNSYFIGDYSFDFIVPIRKNWLLMDKNGYGIYLGNKQKLKIPEVSVPIMDLKSMNRSLAILSKDHILILNVQNK